MEPQGDGKDSAPQQAGLPALADREGVLDDLERVICEAWASFDAPRAAEPQLDETLIGRLDEPLPEEACDVEVALAEAARVLDASISPSRPLYLGYIGSTGLEIGVLASALMATYDANLAVAAGGADIVEEQTLRWVSDFVGFPFAEGAFTSGGMTSNLTALLAARERALPGAAPKASGTARPRSTAPRSRTTPSSAPSRSAGSGATPSVRSPSTTGTGCGPKPWRRRCPWTSPPASFPSLWWRRPVRRSRGRSTRSTR